MHEVHQPSQKVGIGVRQDAMPEVEDMPGPVARSAEDVASALGRRIPAGEQPGRVEVALDAAVADAADAVGQRGAPVDPHDVRTGLGHQRQQVGGADAEVDPGDALMRKIGGIAAAYLDVQVEAGASAVQLFDSWAGALTPADYRASVMPHSERVLTAAGELGVPRIHFGVGTGELLGLMGEAGADVVGVDWRVPLAEAARRVGPGKALQGNLDPAVLFAGREAVEAKTREILDAAAGLEGHVFNLGHGVLPTTDPDALTRLVEYVHTQTAR